MFYAVVGKKSHTKGEKKHLYNISYKAQLLFGDHTLHSW